MVVVENTHNLAGGAFYPLETLKGIRGFAREKGINVHMDGARLFNASAASGAGPREIAAQTDTLTFCLSKGLGAPVGAMLCGSRSFIAEARRVRKMLGGGMRQAGVLAAAGIYALTHNVERLAEDHENARLIAQALAESRWASLDPESVPTNIVYAQTPKHPAETVSRSLRERGVLCGVTGMHELRFVTHLDLSRSDIEEAAGIIGKLSPE
jgi:threonine aldolase